MACLEAMVAGLETTGQRFEAGACFVPNLMMAGALCNYEGSVVLGTAQGDFHDIGENLVGFMLESSGFKVVDLGTDVAPRRFVQAAEEEAASLLPMSALLTTTMLGLPQVLAALEGAGLRKKVKVIVGGGRFRPDLPGSSAPTPTLPALLRV